MLYRFLTKSEGSHPAAGHILLKSPCPERWSVASEPSPCCGRRKRKVRQEASASGSVPEDRKCELPPRVPLVFPVSALLPQTNAPRVLASASVSAVFEQPRRDASYFFFSFSSSFFCNFLLCLAKPPQFPSLFHCQKFSALLHLAGAGFCQHLFLAQRWPL